MLTTANLTRVWPLGFVAVRGGELAALRLFRFVAGTIIALWASQQSSPLAAAADSGAAHSGFVLTELIHAWLALLGPVGPWRLVAASAGLIALGVMPRIAAFTLAVVLAARSADDANVERTIAAFFAVWLVMLPSAAPTWPWRRAVRSASGQRSAAVRPGSDLTTRLFLVNLGLLYLNSGFWSRLHPGWQPLSALGFVSCAVPSLLLLERNGVWRRSSVVLQLGFHVTLIGMGGNMFCHSLFATTGLLSLRPVPALPHTAAAAAPTLDAAAACAGALTLTVCVALVAQLLHSTVHFATSMELLRDLARIADLYLVRRLGP